MATKPTDQIVFEQRPDGQEVAIHNQLIGGPGGYPIFQGEMPLPDFVSGLSRLVTHQASLNLGLIPTGLTVRWIERMQDWYIFMVEEGPSMHTIKWLRDNSPAPYGSSATYNMVTLALPWMYFFVVLHVTGSLSPRNSVYFRNQPLASLNDQLCDPHFYNCSVDAYDTHCWICTQYVAPLRSESFMAKVDSFINWFWNSGFNASSEAYEVQKGSFWTYNRQRIADARVQSINAWVTASQRDPTFATTVPWVKTEHTPLTVCKELVAASNKTCGANKLSFPCTTYGFANLIQELSSQEE